jgi:hypothetical protein
MVPDQRFLCNGHSSRSYPFEKIRIFNDSSKINHPVDFMIKATNTWNDRIHWITDTFGERFGKMTVEELNWKPSESGWSIAQVIKHIIVTNRSYFSIFEQVKNNTFKTPWIGKIPWIPDLTGRMILSYVQPDRKKRSKTARLWEPSRSQIKGDLLDRFKDHQLELLRWIRILSEYTDRDLIIHSPASKMIVYPLPMAIEIIITHEERHLNQAREVLEMMKQ